jgi:exosome complex component RRP41
MIFFLSFAAAINAATLALIDAGVAMKDFLVACSALYIDRVPLLGAS